MMAEIMIEMMAEIMMTQKLILFVIYFIRKTSHLRTLYFANIEPNKHMLSKHCI